MRKHKKNTVRIVRKRFATVMGSTAAIVLSAAVAVSSIWNDAIEAQAADTLLGIEKLRNQVALSGKEYTILEIVPYKDAAEIGFLVDGYEPILSEWDEEEGNWISWKEQLVSYLDAEDRMKFVEGKKEELRAYYSSKYALTDKEWENDFPVYGVAEEYEESDGPQEGFEQISGADVTRTGYFNYNGINGKYQIAFNWVGKDNIEDPDNEKKVLYYMVDDAIDMATLDWGTVPENIDDLYVYEKIPILGENLGNDNYYYVPHLWGDVKEAYLENLQAPIADEDEVIKDVTDIEEGKDLENPNPETPDPENPNPETPDSENPDSEIPDSENPNPETPDPENPDSEIPDAETPDSENPDAENSDSETADPATAPVPTTLSVRISSSQGRWIKTVSEDSNLADQDPAYQDSANQDPVDQDPAGQDPVDQDPTDQDPVDQDPTDQDPADQDPTDQNPADQNPTNPDLAANEDSETDSDAVFVDEYNGESSYKLYIVQFKRIEGHPDMISRYAVNNPEAIRESLNGYGAYDFVKVEVPEVPENPEESEGSEEPENPDDTKEPENQEDEYVQAYTFIGKDIYCRNTFKSNEWFKKYVLDMEESDYEKFSVRVITLTPDELNKMETLPEFDFLYLNFGLRSVSADGSAGNGNNGSEGSEGGDEAGEGSDGTGEGGGETGEGSDETGNDADLGGNGSNPGGVGSVTYYKPYTVENDLSPETLKYLVDRTVAGALPCLVDGAILYEKEESGAIVIKEALKETLIFKLAAVMCQDSLEEWYEKNKADLTGTFVDDLIKGVADDADKNFVTEQVYCRFDDVSIINKDFYTATIYKEGGEMEQGFQKVLDEILLDNTYRAADSSGNYDALSTDIGQAAAVRHIINYQNRRKVETKKSIKVLEIQPAKADEPELTLEQLQAWAPGVEEAEITVMTTAEFIGKIDKLNETYDLIYIGTSEDHLNVKYWDWKTPTSNTEGSPSASGKVSAGTVFNDSNMDGLIYYNIGDLRAASVPLAGQLDTEYVDPGDRSGDVFAYNYYRYGGNDITKEKKEALLSFLDGSYPVIVADDFMEQPVTVFGDADYKGARVSLSVGEYTREDLNKLGGVLAVDVSSIKVKKGYMITIFDGNNFDGNSLTLDENTDNLRSFNRDGKDWNNVMYSAIVERVEDETPVKRIDEDHIDNCTYLYDFVKTAMKDNYTNFYTWSEIEDDSELFKFYLNRPKVSVEQLFVNGVREEDGEIYYISSGTNGRYSLEFHFAIHNEGAASANSLYQCRLYIDINSDGKFSEEEEVSDISLTQGGGSVSADALYTDREYVLTRGVPDGYKGLLPWKVEIMQADNENIYASMRGYTKLEGMEKEKIDVIQISRTPWRETDVLNLEKELADENSVFHALVDGGVVDGVKYKGISDDYEIKVDCMTIAEYEQLFYENPDCMKEYNMLILGFSDLYDNFSGNSEEGPMSAIVDFINSGKSVLFAHDTTSFVNYPEGVSGHADKTNPSSTEGAVRTTSYFAAGLNKYVRGLVGMDRYGILSTDGEVSDILRQGQALQEGSSSYELIAGSGKDVAYEPKSNKERTVPQVHGYTYHIINLKDSDASNNRKTDFTPAELDPGMSGTFSNTFRNIRYDLVYYQWSGTDHGEGQNSGAVSYMNVTRVNEGQITEYPYHLPEEFMVATTHGQYYELDFTADDDGDGQSDLVVWYCLGNRTVNDENQETIYSQSPNDVRNNYYIYNKGNVTYTGMGHGATHDDKPYTVDEAKLFINTIIAAYQAGVKHPYITVLKSGQPESAELKTMYRYYDTSGGISTALDDLATSEDSEKIYFKVQDLNFVKGSRAISTHVFYEADGGGEIITVGGKQISVNRIADNIFNAADGSPADANNLRSNGIYYILVPKSVLGQCDEGLNLYFEAQTTITTNTVNQNQYVTDKVYGKVRVLKAFLFDLE